MLPEYLVRHKSSRFVDLLSVASGGKGLVLHGLHDFSMLT